MNFLLRICLNLNKIKEIQNDHDANLFYNSVIFSFFFYNQLLNLHNQVNNYKLTKSN